MKCVMGLVLLGVIGVVGINYFVRAKQESATQDISNAVRDDDAIFPPITSVPMPTFVENSNPRENQEADLPLEEIAPAIARIESDLANSKAIERLNQNIASSEERAHYDDLFKARDELNKQRLELKMVELNKKISALEDEHASRLDAYGVKREKTFNE